jgi:hypothetical protein
MTTTETDIVVAAIPAAATVTVGVLAALAAYLASKRERRRVLYSEATKAALAWKEMLYRVRRRRNGQEQALVDQFHEIQNQINYYHAWVGSESAYIQHSYDRLVAGIKAATGRLISEAWAEAVRPLPANATPGDEHPDLTPLVDRFLRDVRSQLSPWPWRKLAVRYRNRSGS